MSTDGSHHVPRLSLGYNVVRSLQLEGRVHVPSEGCWPITSVRVSKGWGYPDEDDYPDFGKSWLFPPPEPPDLDTKAKKFRIAYYMRTYTAEQCVAAIAHLLPVNAAFEITDAWINPPDGLIPAPTKHERIVGSHSVLILGTDPTRKEFIFDSGWGRKWGKDGMGRLPFSYFENRLIDAYYQMIARPDLKKYYGIRLPLITQFLWGHNIPGEPGNIVHIREIYDASLDEYIGWAIVTERGEWLDVHELFVKPRNRKRGHGRSLMWMMQELSQKCSKQLRFWVSFADFETSSILVKLLRPMDFVLRPSPERWAAFVGIKSNASIIYFDIPQSTSIPVRPTASTPPSVKEAVTAFTLAASLVSSGFPDPRAIPNTVANEPTWEYGGVTSEKDNLEKEIAELRPGTDEFDQKNSRRHYLIEKKVDGRITAEEEAEYQALQAEILDITKKYFPRHRPNCELWLNKMKEGANPRPDLPNSN